MEEIPSVTPFLLVGKGNHKVRKFLFEALTLLEQKIPPPFACHHGLTLEGGNLVIEVNRGAEIRSLIIEDADMTGTPAEFVAAVVEGISRRRT